MSDLRARTVRESVALVPIPVLRGNPVPNPVREQPSANFLLSFFFFSSASPPSDSKANRSPDCHDAGSTRRTLNNRRGPRAIATPTRIDSTIHHSSHGSGGRADDQHTSSEMPLRVAPATPPLEDAPGDNVGQLSPTSSQWSRGTAPVSLSHQESISLSDMMHPSHDMPSSQRRPSCSHVGAPGTSPELAKAVWDLLGISQQAYDQL